MTKPFLPLGAALIALALTAAGAAQAADAAKPRPQRACFLARNVDSWSATDDHTVYVKVGVKEVYRLDLLGSCPDIDWSWKLGLVSHGSSWICSPMDATIIAESPIGPQRCPVRAVTRLTPQEVAALPPKKRP